jgi:hypothetical protein
VRSGDYTVTPYGQDKLGNWTNTNSGDDSDVRAQFRVLGGSDDDSGPRILSLSVSDAVVSPGDTFTVTAHVADPAGVESVGSWFTVGGRQNDFCGQNMTFTDGTARDGRWTKTCKVPSAVRSGDYTVTPYGQDKLGNWTNTNSGDDSDVRAHFQVTG